MSKINLKVKLAYQDIGYCREYYKVTEGKYASLIICALDTEPEPGNWHNVPDNEVEGEPGFPIAMKRFSIEVFEPE